MMTNKSTKDKTSDEASGKNEPVVMRDIKTQMLKVTEKQPINNSGSFSMTLLWQIFEEAEKNFEERESLGLLNDEYIEGFFEAAFPNFIANYPDVMQLDA